MKKDKFYRACCIVENGDKPEYFKDMVEGYTQTYEDGVVLHCYLNNDVKIVIEHLTGLALGDFHCSYKNAFDLAYLSLRDYCLRKGVNILDFLKSIKPVNDYELKFCEVQNEERNEIIN